MEILSILTGAFVAGVDLGIKKYTEENVRDGEERRIWKGKGIYRKVHNKGLMMNHLDSRPKLVKGMSAAALGILFFWEHLLWKEPGRKLAKITKHFIRLQPAVAYLPRQISSKIFTKNYHISSQMSTEIKNHNKIQAKRLT